MKQMARMGQDGLIRSGYIGAMRLSAVVVTLCLLLVGCGARTAAPEPANPWPEEPLALSLPPVDPQEYLYLFDYDRAAPLDVQEVERWHESQATWTDLTYASPRGGRVPATPVVPDGRGPFAGIVLMHGGAADSNRRDLFPLAAAYARMGAVVALIDAPFARPENRNPPRRYGPMTWTEQDREELVQLIVDLRRAVDLLAARPDVDAQRMAYVGNSFGGATGGLLAGVEDRLPAYALVVGDGGWVEHYTGPDDRHSYPAGPFFTVSEEGQRRWLEAMWPIEPIHYVGRAGPAALLFQNGTRDVNVPPRDALRFQQAGSEPKTILWYDSAHSLPNQAWQDQAAWLQRHIGAGAPWLVLGFRASALALSWLLLAWTVLTVGALAFVVWNLWRDASVTWGRRVLWPLATLLLGPLGLLAYVASQRWPGPAREPRVRLAAWRRALGSLAWMVTGHAVGVIAIVIYLFTRVGPSSVWLQLALLYVVPLLTGLVAWLAMRRAARTVPALQGAFRYPLLAAVVSTNAAMAGVNLVLIVLLNTWFPLGLESPSPALWTILSLSTSAGALCTYPAHLWMAGRGLVGWRAMPAVAEAAGEGEQVARRPRWYEALGVVLFTYAALVVAIGAALVIITDLPIGEIVRLLAAGS